MTLKSYKEESINGRSENGCYSKKEWLQEGRNSLLSAKLLKRAANDEKEKFLEAVKVGDRNRGAKVFASSTINAYGKSGLLLLGYAIELFLKAGLVCVYQRVPRGAFDQLIKKHGHNYNKIADFLGINLTIEEIALLDRAKVLVTNEGRYPVTPEGKIEYYDQQNKVNHEVWSQSAFDDLAALAEKIGSQVAAFDADSSNPAHRMTFENDQGDEFSFRVGGNLPAYGLLTSEQLKTESELIEASEQFIDLIENQPNKSISMQLLLNNQDNFTLIGISKQKNANGDVKYKCYLG